MASSTRDSLPKKHDPTSLLGSAAEVAGEVVGTVESAASGLVVRAREARHDFGEVTGSFRTAVDKSVRRQPMTSLLIMGAVGFVLGALWKS